MAVRIRANRKTIICAAKSDALPGDYYLDDCVHYILAVELGVLRCIGINSKGADLWEFCVMEAKVEEQNENHRLQNTY